MAQPDGYPFATAAAGSSCIAFVEGRADGRPHAVEALARQLADAGRRNRLAADPEHRAAFVRALSFEGDFVAGWIDTEADVAIVWNDRLGRMPVQISTSLEHAATGPAGPEPAAVVVGRMPLAVARLAGRDRLDRHAAAQAVWLGYPLGNGP